MAPTGHEAITITVPEAENEVSILGEKLSVERADGRASYASPGRPIAIISNVMIEFVPPPPARTPAKRPPAARPPVQ